MKTQKPKKTFLRPGKRGFDDYDEMPKKGKEKSKKPKRGRKDILNYSDDNYNDDDVYSF